MIALSLSPPQNIARKRDGHALKREDIAAFVRGATDGSWADYQLSALMMAIFFRGMTAEETAGLTEAVMRSGEMADMSAGPRPKVDKHSTGGVGDKVSLYLAPMVAACGVVVPMISGRALGHTGGTLDKLESIPGFRVNLGLAEFQAQVERIGVAIIGQSAELVPADKKLYALRDVTATVECVPLICASIMGKKLAEGIDALVLDVKFGRGAFMKEKAQARDLAMAMVAIGRAMRKPVRAVLTAMDQPLGRAVGNALEVAEAIAGLRGEGPADLKEVAFGLGEQMLLLAGLAVTAREARRQLEAALESGAALAKFREIVIAQGGDPRVTDEPARLPQARYQRPVKCARGGTVQAVDAWQVARVALELGAGRTLLEETIDPAVGVSRLLKVGESVPVGGNLCVVHANDERKLDHARAMLAKAITVGEGVASAPKLIDEILE